MGGDASEAARNVRLCELIKLEDSPALQGGIYNLHIISNVVKYFLFSDKKSR